MIAVTIYFLIVFWIGIPHVLDVGFSPEFEETFKRDLEIFGRPALLALALAMMVLFWPMVLVGSGDE